MEWDYFISHASEDKPLVASPLAHYLRSVGFRVWYDRFTLKLGDSLLAGINTGLANSAFGVVVLSPSFFAKHWPQRELAGLMAVAQGERRILPVWHEVGADDVVRTSPILADLVGVSTRRGLNAVAEEIIRASYPDRLDSLPASNVGRESSVDLKEARATLTEMLNNSASRDDVFLLLSAYQELLSDSLGRRPSTPVIPASRTCRAVPFDFALVESRGASRPVAIRFIVLGPTQGEGDAEALIRETEAGFGQEDKSFRRSSFGPYSGRIVGAFPEVSKVARELAGWAESRNLYQRDPESWSFTVTLLNGRRIPDQSAGALREELAAASRLPLRIASYDRLTDTDVPRDIR
ncbi:toll/interleukin-1 receptor domain-containing protein [Streptomyces sp. NBC_00019]|uniref:toll/interleukin-1 receptor domain-containing protein n=1 Tax=Streptomyces sp. NBC_00019 TaxID=2975623 RepID=UPI0032453292